MSLRMRSSRYARVRDEVLDAKAFSSLAEARLVIGDWREDYNHRRPHSALAMKTPLAFAATWTPTTAARGREPLRLGLRPRLRGTRPAIPLR